MNTLYRYRKINRICCLSRDRTGSQLSCGRLDANSSRLAAVTSVGSLSAGLARTRLSNPIVFLFVVSLLVRYGQPHWSAQTFVRRSSRIPHSFSSTRLGVRAQLRLGDTSIVRRIAP